ncbi:hypothetical protein ACWD45_32520 [Streptomyces rubiginosohelvolus]
MSGEVACARAAADAIRSFKRANEFTPDTAPESLYTHAEVERAAHAACGCLRRWVVVELPTGEARQRLTAPTGGLNSGWTEFSTTDKVGCMDIRTELDNFLGEKRALVDAITREFRSGTAAKAIARSVSPAFSRDQVTQYLAAVALHDSARTALQEAELELVEVRVTGIDAPREALLTVVADRAETPDYEDLPSRIRSALRDFHITLDLPQGEHDEITDDLVDTFLLDGDTVRLVKLKPRT